MPLAREVVITGTGVVSPIGIGREAFWASLRAGKSGVRPLPQFEKTMLPVKFGADIPDFDGKLYVKPRKSMKVMSREIQQGFSAAELALADAGLADGAVDAERFGVVYGSEMLYTELGELADVYRRCVRDGEFRYELFGEHILADLYPLWMLKYLPNMVACHVGITHDARGPNNTYVLGDVSSLLAVHECVRKLESGVADVMIAGGIGTRLNIANSMYRTFENVSRRFQHPTGACRPFDRDRDGLVNGEGAGAMVLETREFAERRGAKPLARVLGLASTFGEFNTPGFETAIANAIRGALASAGLSAADVGHVNTHGLGTIEDDIAEAQAIRSVLGHTPVTSLKSYFGHLGTGTGLVELIGSVLALEAGEVPPTLNFQTPDPKCPVDVIQGRALTGAAPVAVKLSHSFGGEVAAVVIAGA